MSSYSTMQTGCLTGGIKRSSDVNVFPEVAEAWAEVRNDTNPSIDWLIAGYEKGSKTDIIIFAKGNGGVGGCSSRLPTNESVFGGCRLKRSGRFVTFFYADEGASVMQKGRASMHKNGVLNVLEGSDREITMRRGINDEDELTHDETVSSSDPPSSPAAAAPSSDVTTDTTKPSSETTFSSSPIALDSNGFIPYSQLKNLVDSSRLPSGVDPSRREQWLSNEEFEQVFGMSKNDFSCLLGWKKTSQKKEKGLF